MNKHTMTDAEIKKALKICGNVVDADCKECSYEGKNCVVRLIQSTNDLINRQKAEIERLSKELIKQQLKNNMLYETAKEAKAEAVKEFVERLKTKVDLDLCEAINCSDYLYDLPKRIDNLVKEMTEVKNNG